MNKDNTKEKENEIRRILDGQKRGLTENQLTNKIDKQQQMLAKLDEHRNEK